MADLDRIDENLAELLTNTVDMAGVFYDIFLNPVPMDVTLKMFDDNNELIDVTIPNRAKDRVTPYIGEGSPEGEVAAPIGSVYIDTVTATVYYKVSGEATDPNGWNAVLSQVLMETYIRTYLESRGYVNTASLRVYLVENEYVDVTKLADYLDTNGYLKSANVESTTIASLTDDVMIFTGEDSNRLRKIELGNILDDVVSTDENNAIGRGSDSKLTVALGEGLELSAGNEVEVAIASEDHIGGIKIGDGLEVAPDGTTSVVGGGGSHSSSRNIGEVVSSAVPVVDAGLHLLDGSLILGAGVYEDFVNYMADLYGDGTDIPAYFCSEADWQDAVINYGVCGKFVYDSEANSIRLPRIMGVVEGTTNVRALGDLVEAGLPNINGEWSSAVPDGYEEYCRGAIKYKTTNSRGNGTGLSGIYGYELDASSSNEIYGNSDTVQPQTIKVLYYICIATSSKTDVEVDIDNIVAELNDIRSQIGESPYNALFDIVPKDHILSYEETKGLAQLGTYVYKEAVAGARYGYADFYDKCLEEYNESTPSVIPNVDIIGTVNNNNGVLSGFNSTSCVTGRAFSPSTSNWEVNLKFTTSSNVTSEQAIINTTTEYQSMFCSIVSDGRLVFQGFADGTSTSLFIMYSTSTMAANTTYWVKLIYDSASGYALQISTDGTTYTTEGTTSVTTPITSGQTLLFGSDNVGGYLGGHPFKGYLDLNEFHIDINGQRWWSGVITCKQHQNGHRFYDIADKAAIDFMYENTGEAWLYGIDTAHERIFLPRSTRIKFGSTSEVGEHQEAGLPNITGTFSTKYAEGATGAFKGTSVSDNHGFTSVSGNSHQIVGLDASRSSSIYGNSSTVEYSSTKMIPYMVVGVIDSETAATDIVDVTTTENDTIPLFTGMYFDLKPNNAAWVLAGGQVAKGTIYTFAYNELVNELTTPKYNLQVIREQDMVSGTDYSTYWVVNEVGQYFICPTKLSYGAYKLGEEAPVKGTGMTLGLTTGSHNYGFCASSNTVFNVSSSGYGSPLPGTGSTAGAENNWLGVTTDATKSGIVADLSAAQATSRLYFKVANAVQNLEVLDAGEVLEAVNDIIPDNSSLIAGYAMPSNTYEDLTLGSTNATYTAPANGWVIFSKKATASFQNISLIKNGVIWDLAWSAGSDINIFCYMPVRSGETFSANYSAEGTLMYFRFYYAVGSESEAQ